MQKQSNLFVAERMWTFLIILFSISVSFVVSSHPSSSENKLYNCSVGWNYNNTNDWSKCHPQCGGLNQSPINIVSSNAIKKEDPPLNFVNYDKILDSYIIDSGHTLGYKINTSNVPANQMPSISGGGLVGNYTFHSIHWHWSVEKNAHGSDHTLDNKHYPVEMHLVHVNAKYDNINDAKNQSDGIAVLGVFMEETKWYNVPMRHFINLVNSTTMKIGMEVNVVVPLPLMDMLPDETDTFYRYSGSLTTPDCQESVTWIIFKTTLQISSKQVPFI